MGLWRASGRGARVQNRNGPSAPPSFQASTVICEETPGGLRPLVEHGCEVQPDHSARLVAALLGETPLVEDLRQLTDEIGGRPDGTEANRRAVEWALERFRSAGVEARKEAFTVSERWLERSARAEAHGEPNPDGLPGSMNPAEAATKLFEPFLRRRVDRIPAFFFDRSSRRGWPPTA